MIRRFSRTAWAFLHFRDKGQLRLLPILAVTALLGGIGVGAAFSLLFDGWDWPAFLLGVPVGIAVGTTIWLIAVRGAYPAHPHQGAPR